MYLDFLSKFGIGGAHPGGLNLTKEMLKGEQINETTTILDVGCGTGQTAAFLALQYGANITGMDINPIMVEKAKNRMATYKLPVEIIQGSIEDIPLKDKSFDFILSESVISFVDKKKALREIHRVLRDGGRFIANELTINKQPQPKDEEEIKSFYGFDSLPVESDWAVLLEQAGFKNIAISRNSQPIFQTQSMPEFHYSDVIEPKLFEVFTQHYAIMLKYQNILDYRILACTK
ncbi:class I SAM-dependent methyltransferase [Bacillus sp. FJAT-27245]|uniref:class I SAM-dependent methyltransferase n=1 Tax=Bacillus sp. FJAT-27245 TaxID=1684144 RepID=UPI001E388509|nr:class I SAM-dependent methyltransferase [Bacillus sp. FJAT-27245]